MTYDLALVPSSERNSLSSQGCSAMNLEEGNKLLHGGMYFGNFHTSYNSTIF